MSGFTIFSVNRCYKGPHVKKDDGERDTVMQNIIEYR